MASVAFAPRGQAAAVQHYVEVGERAAQRQGSVWERMAQDVEVKQFGTPQAAASRSVVAQRSTTPKWQSGLRGSASGGNSQNRFPTPRQNVGRLSAASMMDSRQALAAAERGSSPSREEEELIDSLRAVQAQIADLSADVRERSAQLRNHRPSTPRRAESGVTADAQSASPRTNERGSNSEPVRSVSCGTNTLILPPYLTKRDGATQLDDSVVLGTDGRTMNWRQTVNVAELLQASLQEIRHQIALSERQLSIDLEHLNELTFDAARQHSLDSASIRAGILAELAYLKEREATVRLSLAELSPYLLGSKADP